MHAKILFLVGLGALLAGCASSIPMFGVTDVPASWEQGPAADAPIWPQAGWWQGFASEELNAIISAVQADNLSLAAAEARVLAADARVRQAGASLLPGIGVAAGARDGNGIGSLNISANASYELDFWGANRAGLAAAESARRGSRADRETVALTAVSSAASTYFQLLSLRQRLETARLNLEIAFSVLDVTRARVRNGIASPLELAQQLGTVASQQAAIPQLEQQELQSRAALALLTGRPPAGFDVVATNLDAISTPAVAPGLPSDLLVRRPDIVSAEASLETANANLAAARAAFFPSISLTGSASSSSPALIELIANPAQSLSIGLSLSQTIFDAGARSAQADAAAAREQEVLANYRNVIITAFSEVETTLGNISNLAEQETFQIEQALQAQRAFDIVNARYREGATEYLSVLDAQRTLYQSQDQLDQIKFARLQALVTLYRVLGGGWRDPATAGFAQN